MKKVSKKLLVDCIKIIGARQHNLKNINLQIPKIDKGESACITFFDPSKRDKFSTDNIISTSKNCAFIDFEIIGKVYGCINENKIHYNKN